MRELDIVRETRRKTLTLVEGLSQKQLDGRPSADKWSIGEVLDHLVLADGIARRDFAELIELARTGREPFLVRRFSDFNPSLLFFPKPLLPFVELPLTVFNLFMPHAVRDFLVRNRVLPAQHADATTPRRGRLGEDLRNELDQSLAATVSLFAAHSDLDFSCMRHLHPIQGLNDVPGLLRFIANHEGRHQQQIREALWTA